ncbi:maleylpyruvate isomerase [Zafaria cholistanensis]|uniref:Maleylpyruvate isomerase n=1 Tax=Zafaria cholistanensis TaxID=1682741 RepID=A0A5A7NUG4_9MICC|nr:maleylpyruvate isomerase family mycothiol-dependent enzyme [Zafaria cholistanensis]GER24453.1 maleylpyruvate isomerase [Zafaria cholistanensis]
MTRITPTDLAGAVHDAAENFRRTVDRLEDAAFRTPSALPGWSKAHVLAHTDGVLRALARQLEHARHGRRIEFYDGGMEGRNRRIELGVLMAPAQLRSRLGEALDLFVAELDAVPAGGWHAAASFRGEGTVMDCVLGAWRELTIHAGDLGGTAGPVDWTPEFCAHLFDFLAERVPAGARFVLQPTGRPPVVLGEGRDSWVLAGMEYDLAAWLAGREPSGQVRATAAADAADLPELGPWPSALLVKPVEPVEPVEPAARQS